MFSKYFKLILAVAWISYCLYGIIVNYSHYSFSDWIVVLLLMAFPFVVYKLFCKIKNSSTSKSQRKVHNKHTQQIIQRQASLSLSAMHVSGLPIAENVLCTIYSTPFRYEIVASGNTFNLDKSKITDMSIKTETEITTQYTSSIGGAVGGAILFGPLGAAIGGRAKKKNSKKIHQYLIITYESDGEIKYIGFDVTANFKASNFVKEFNSTVPKHNTNINL